MRRVLSVYLPLWPIERRRRSMAMWRDHASPRETQRNAPLLLVAMVASRQIVASACAASMRAGVRVGMVLADARALLRQEPVVAAAEPEKDAAGLESLARWAMRWSPIVSSDRPDGIVLDITGCEHLFGGERPLVESLTRGLRRLGLTARAASGSNVGAAWAVARFARTTPTLIEAGREREALAELPVRALRVSEQAIDGLAEVGVERIGQVLALPRSALPARYGQEILRRIDQALGAAFEPVGRVAEEVRIVASVDLPGGTTDHDTLGLAARDVLTDLATQLERRESGARRVVVAFKRLDEGEVSIDLRVSRPTREAPHLWKLLRPKLERLHLGFGIECITAEAAAVSLVPHEQATLGRRACDRGEDDRAFAEMLDTIANRIGREQVRRAERIQSHRPERAARFVPYGTGQHEPVWSTEGALIRPSRLVEPPVPIEVIALSPDGPVVRLSRGSGEPAAITACLGPERIGGEWWRVRESGRDYFRVQDDSGLWLWIFRETHTGSWFIHGEWA